MGVRKRTTLDHNVNQPKKVRDEDRGFLVGTYDCSKSLMKAGANPLSA